MTMPGPRGAVIARRCQASLSRGRGGISFLQWSSWSRWQPAGRQRSRMTSLSGKGDWALRTRYTSSSVIVGQRGQAIPARVISMRRRVHTPAAYRLGLVWRPAWRAGR